LAFADLSGCPDLSAFVEEPARLDEPICPEESGCPNESVAHDEPVAREETVCPDDSELAGESLSTDEPALPEPEPAPTAAVGPDDAEEVPHTPDEVACTPAFQVDGFAWSQRASSLRLAAGIQVDRLADALAAGIEEGRKVAGVGAHRRGQGATTVLLSAAKRLADRDLKVAVVDADFDHPSLAEQLGILPEAGLEAVLAGRLSVEDVLIESVNDSMAVLPLREPCAATVRSPEGQAALIAALDRLRRHYDLVLLDLGQFVPGACSDAGPDASEEPWVDAMVLVQDVRLTPRAELVEVAQRLESAGIVSLGVVENFV